MEKKKFGIVHRPESHDEISHLVRRLLAKANALDELPTPIERLFQVAKIQEIEDLPDPDGGFLSSLGERALNAFFVAKQKIRGMADMRERVVYIPKQDKPPRILFAQGHELGHQCMPWHNIEPAYQDDNYSLCPDVNRLFEQEANDFSAETIFQGTPRFRRRARDYHAELSSVFHLADVYGASKQATAWRFAEEQDHAVAAVYYYPHKFRTDEFGNPALVYWKAVGSAKFLGDYADIELPDVLNSTHPWAVARFTNKVVSGTDVFRYDAKGEVTLNWDSWWNQYTLIVLLRRRHIISSISSVFLRQ
jgi:hypothetical protein